MKPKIIYISGNEVFDIADIRAAFDTVRDALGLAPDTVLFGVPVDRDASVLSTTTDAAIAPATPIITSDIATDTVADAASVHTAAPIIDIATAEPTPTVDLPVKRPRGRPRANSATINIEPIVESHTDTTEPAPVPDTMDTDSNTIMTDETPIVPILSVLGKKDEPTPDTFDSASPEPEPEQNNDSNTESAPDIADTDVIDTTVTDDIAESVPETEITPAIDDTEKTLEQLLESMAPLSEDKETAIVESLESDDEIVDITAQSDDDDVTLEHLASEFVASADKIATPDERPQTGGKIGKLKNILPFKKAKRNDSGLMGDLFGWAGIAANDEEFSIPGFFTNAASKK
ncbi:MAG: hypothetical protein IJ560_01520 [Alphaproteobacteria bacterium]|nr:hypothetical protein [Alphaproteobacteria bacterium]